MKIYLFEKPSDPLPQNLRTAASNCGFEVRVLPLPDDHEEISGLMRCLDPGVVVIPDRWEDLFCVKAAQEVVETSGPFEVIIWGSPPGADKIITAFNEGVCGFLSMPFVEDDFRRLFLRAARRVEKRVEINATARRGAALVENLEIHHPMSVPGREAVLAGAFADFFNRRGPFFERETRVLAAVPSPAQAALLTDALRNIGVTSETCGSIADAARLIRLNGYTCVVTSCVLEDASAAALPRALIDAGVSTLPWIIGWTSSLDMAVELRKPGSGIDDTVLKTGHDHGIGSLILAVIASTYNG